MVLRLYPFAMDRLRKQGNEVVADKRDANIEELNLRR